MSNARDKANIPVLNFQSKGIDDNADSAVITLTNAEDMLVGTGTDRTSNLSQSSGNVQIENGLIFESGSSSTNNEIMTYRTNSLVFGIGASEKMRITSTGLAIGTTSHTTGANLTLAGQGFLTSGADSGSIAFGSNASYQGRIYQDNNGSDFYIENTYSNNNGDIIVKTNGSERLRVKGDGKIGFGNTSPTGALDVKSSTQPQLKVATASATAERNAGFLVTANNSATGSARYLKLSLDADGGDGSGTDNLTITKTGGDGDATITNESNANIVFGTNNTERMRLNSTGLGLGTTSPSEKLHVVGHIKGNSLNIPSNTSSPPSGVTIHQPSTNVMAFRTDSVERVRIDNNSGDRLFIGTTSDVSHGLAENNRLIVSGYSGNGAGMIGFQDTSGNTDGTITVSDGSMTIGADTENTTASSSLRFRVDNNEKMRITDNGRLQLATTSNMPYGGDAVRFSFEFNSSSAGQYYGMEMKDNGSAGTTYGIVFSRSSAIGSITYNASSVSYNTSSDYRLKENVSYDFDATTRLKQLKPARFNFIADADKTVDGFLAHEVSSVVPEAITGEKDAVNEDGSIQPQGIDQAKLVPLLVKTIQELEARITTLEANNP